MPEKLKAKERDEKGQLVPGHEIRRSSGAWLFLRSGRVPSIKGSRRLQKHLNNLRTRLMECVPNSQDCRREVIISQVVKCEGFLVLIESYLKRAGLLDPVAFKQGRLETQGALTACISFMNCQLRSLQVLGMDSKALDEIKAPYEIVQQEERKEKKKSDGHSPSTK